ncbi:MAG: outer membrane lipoprotein-sorting protein [Candidatus Ozemobacteraceae bacterium]
MRLSHVVLAGFMFVGQSLFAVTADEVLQGVENRNIGKTSQSDVTMKLKNSDGAERNRSLKIYRRKVDNDNKDNFIHFLSPSDMKDTTYLVNEKNREKSKWIYLSAYKNVRKIVATDYAVSFVSSDFTYEDMEDIHASDYACSDLKEEKLDGQDVYSIVCKKKDTNTSYSHAIMKVAKDKMVVLKSFMFDKNDPTKQIKEMTASDLKQIQNIWTPMVVAIKDLKKNSSTALEVKKIEYEVALPDETFTERNMKK